ncbi:MAG TPA: DedA family protein [Burkholderiales bacterium]|nr:DedA family protein [Burkholderiales bacterium]
MDLGAVIQQYGYAVVFAGALVEGETVLALAGVAARRGYLDLGWVIAIAAFAGFIGDQLYFMLGRRFGPTLLLRFPRLSAAVERADAIIERHETALILGVRFMYGLRVAGPLAFGAGPTRWWRFAVLNFISAMVWAPLFTGAGYVLADALEGMLGDLESIEHLVFIAVAVAGCAFWLMKPRVRTARRRTRPSE